jgi:glucan phosphoethanolaminetransferase (alkaline phosphatase superfamily)
MYIYTKIEDLINDFSEIKYFNYKKDFKIDLENLSKNDNIAFEQKLFDLINDCGCNLGKIMVAVFVFTFLTLCSFIETTLIQKIIIVITSAIFGGIFGKFYTLISNKRKMMKIILKVEKHIKQNSFTKMDNNLLD